MSKRTYEEYIKNGCHPVGYNEPCQSYYFGQVSVDWLLDQIDQLKPQLENLKSKLREANREKNKNKFFEEKNKEKREKDNKLLEETMASNSKLNLENIVLKQQLSEKDKEIEDLNKTLEICKHIERYDIGEMFFENAKLIIEKRQFAIQELEKVKVELKDKIKIMNNEEHCYPQKFVKWIDVCDQLNQQINDLRGDENGKF